MIKISLYTFIIIIIFACGGKHKSDTSQPKNTKPVLSQGGMFITFPLDSITTNFFKTQTVSSQKVDADITAPARVIAAVVPSNESNQQHLILFDNPDLANSYTQLVQHLITINSLANVVIPRKKDILNHTTDLQKHGAESEENMLDQKTDLQVAEANLANEKAAIIEHETKLKLAGLNSEALRNAKSNTVWVMCDVPENQLDKINTGATCKVIFTAYPTQSVNASVDGVGDLVDNITRMVKIRLAIANPNGKLKAGMYATANFGVAEGNFISVPKSAVVTVQSKNFVFVKKSATEFERKEVSIGQQINDKIIVFSGLIQNDNVVVEGVIQLKGISFGY